MFQKIVVPLDGSARAEAAVPVAARIARSTGASLLLVRIISPPIESPRYLRVLAVPDPLTDEVAEAEIELARSYLQQIARSEALARIKVDVQTAASTAIAETILEMTKQANADLLILCRHGHTGLKRWALGSIAQKLTRHSSIPLLVLHEKSDRQAHLSTEHPQAVQILVALDGSPLAETALAPAAHLGVALSVPEQTTLHLVQVLPLPAAHGLPHARQVTAAARERIIADTHAYLEGVKKNVLTGSLASRNLAVTTSVLVQDDVAEALVNMANAEEKRAEKPETVESMEIIALTTHGRSGLQRWALGSMTERVLESTRQPLLIVHADSSQLS